MAQPQQEGPDTCAICNDSLPPRLPGPGRPRIYCSLRCRMDAQRGKYQAKVAAENQARRELWRQQRERMDSRVSGVVDELDA